jgi:putative peptidoglycan lipid II flippase
MGLAVFACDRILDPWLNGYMVQRYGALLVLVAAGCLIYGVGCFVTRAFRVSDIKALIRKRRPNDDIVQE